MQAKSVEHAVAGTEAAAPARPQSLGRAFRQRFRALRYRTARGLLRCAFAVARGANRTYEPVEIGGRSYGGRRESEARWTVIASALNQYQARSLLDIGCAEGWFLRRAATELGCFALGVEAGERLFLGEVGRIHDGVERMSIMKARLMPEDVRKLPRCDVVMCLSVVHHVIRRHGLETAKDFVRALADRAEKAVIFEMGTSEEKGLRWSGVLPEMAEGQEAFVQAFLEESGLKNVQRLASAPAFHAGGERLLFAGEPVRA